jgi:hypothetical protein
MMCGNLFRLHLAASFINRRSIILRIGVSALFAIPFILVDMPARAQASGIVMVILFTGLFGAAVSHVHLRTDLRLERLTLLPMPRGVLWLDLVLTSIVIRLVPLIIILTGFAAINGQSVTPASLINLFGLLCSSLILLTLLGIVTGQLAHSNGEVHLFGALTCAILAFISGITPLPDRLTWMKQTMVCNPIARLQMALTRLTTGDKSVPLLEFIFALFTISIIIALVILRWISGGMYKSKNN